MLDISRILNSWEYVTEEVTVRMIEGEDHKPKIQMRLDLGLLQMEYSGRPDGKQPHGFESLLEYYQHQRQEHIEKMNSEDGFFLDPDDCASLQHEALQYYYRYLSLFHLEEYEAVERDTDRNLRVFDFIKKYAEDDEDRYSMEQYRPYVLMMNSRAAAHRLLEQNHGEEAILRIEETIARIKNFFSDYGRPEMADKCSEIVFLNQFVEEIRSRWNTDPVQDLREKMRLAVEKEDYEAAARIRDEIRKRMRGAH